MSDAVTALGLEALLSERANFPVKLDLHSHDACLRAVEQCDLFVLVVDGRYGSPYKDEGISITHKEYRTAKALGKPMVVFVRMRIWDERKHYKKNPGMALSFADSPKIFDLLDEVNRSLKDNWIVQFVDAADLGMKLNEKVTLLLADPEKKKLCFEEFVNVWKGKGKPRTKVKRLRKIFSRYSACGFAQDPNMGLFYISQTHRMYYTPEICTRNVFLFDTLNVHGISLTRDVLYLKGIVPVDQSAFRIRGRETTTRTRLDLEELPGGSGTEKRIEFRFHGMKPGARRKFEIEFSWPGPGPEKPQHWHFIPVDCFCMRVGIESIFPSRFEPRDVQVFRGHGPSTEEQPFEWRVIRMGGNRWLRIWVDFPPIDEIIDFRYVLV